MRMQIEILNNIILWEYGLKLGKIVYKPSASF